MIAQLKVLLANYQLYHFQFVQKQEQTALKMVIMTHTVLPIQLNI